MGPFDRVPHNEAILAVYESAQESARHSDILMWQVAAIIWGANAVLMGFIFDAIGEKHLYRGAAVASLVGLALTFFVLYFFSIAKIAQRIAYEKCREIECEFPEAIRLHSKIHCVYEGSVRLKAKDCVVLLTVMFSLVWLGAFFIALCKCIHLR